jgi:hypothetical protein
MDKQKLFESILREGIGSATTIIFKDAYVDKHALVCSDVIMKNGFDGYVTYQDTYGDGDEFVAGLFDEAEGVNPEELNFKENYWGEEKDIEVVIGGGSTHASSLHQVELNGAPEGEEEFSFPYILKLDVHVQYLYEDLWNDEDDEEEDADSYE